MKSAQAIRQEFLDFFASKGHRIVPSAPVVPQDDPTLLFTNAGMNQFKAIFLGENRDNLSRVADSQKCMRVSGKHNDLEEVGIDHYHHTFFEMLGNWSFGDYYKKEAISWAWELVTKVWMLPKDSLWSSVHTKDDDAENFWKHDTDIHHSHIVRTEENFWEMGDTGPCGPCSEIHLDTGVCSHKGNGHTCGVNVSGCDRFLELWNLVFIQFNRQKNGSLQELPNKHIDTGMGLERVVRILQGKTSNYATDLFTPIIQKVESLSNKKYDSSPSGAPFRVIADHIRALSFAITDGALPSNEGRGYVLRRLLRRACRFGRNLGFTEPFLYKVVQTVTETMGAAYPELVQRKEFVSSVIRSEEERFNLTLSTGLEKIGILIDQAKKNHQPGLPGEAVFSLYDTYGFPMDLTRLIAREQNLSIDEEGFSDLMQKQRTRGREAAKTGSEEGLSPEGWVEIRPCAASEFIGYDTLKAEVNVCRYKLLDTDGGGSEALFILDKTPFYASMGGQVGDTGTLYAPGGVEFIVTDTIKWHDLTVHRALIKESVTSDIFTGPLRASVDEVKRTQIRRNHTATHLLQAALRQVLGNHVCQSGSRVAAEGFRFDFSHFSGLSKEELLAVEDQVNSWILQDLPVQTVEMESKVAKDAGAIALFGEKYGDLVRVVSVGKISKELCGGTHISFTGSIGLFHITQESSISAGVRRIEAITGWESLRYLREKVSLIEKNVLLMKTSERELYKKTEDLLNQAKALEQRNEELEKASVGQEVDSLLMQAQNKEGKLSWVVKQYKEIMEKKSFSALHDRITDMIKLRQLKNTVVFIAAIVEDKAIFAANAGDSAIKEFGIKSGDLVKTAAGITGGSGGGSPARAQAGGKETTKISEACTTIENILKQKVNSL